MTVEYDDDTIITSYGVERLTKTLKNHEKRLDTIASIKFKPYRKSLQQCLEIAKKQNKKDSDLFIRLYGKEKNIPFEELVYKNPTIDLACKRGKVFKNSRKLLMNSMKLYPKINLSSLSFAYAYGTEEGRQLLRTLGIMHTNKGFTKNTLDKIFKNNIKVIYSLFKYTYENASIAFKTSTYKYETELINKIKDNENSYTNEPYMNVSERLKYTTKNKIEHGLKVFSDIFTKSEYMRLNLPDEIKIEDIAKHLIRTSKGRNLVNQLMILDSKNISYDNNYIASLLHQSIDSIKATLKKPFNENYTNDTLDFYKKLNKTPGDDVPIDKKPKSDPSFLSDAITDCKEITENMYSVTKGIFEKFDFKIDNKKEGLFSKLKNSFSKPEQYPRGFTVRLWENGVKILNEDSFLSFYLPYKGRTDGVYDINWDEIIEYCSIFNKKDLVGIVLPNGKYQKFDKNLELTSDKNGYFGTFIFSKIDVVKSYKNNENKIFCNLPYDLLRKYHYGKYFAETYFKDGENTMKKLNKIAKDRVNFSQGF